MFVTKHTLASVHDCEVHFLAPDDFEWTPARARGQVAHKAIQLMLNWRGEPSPRELVDEALARLGDEERDFGRWIAALSPGDEADLRGQASNVSASSPNASRHSMCAATRSPRPRRSGRSIIRSCFGPGSISSWAGPRAARAAR